jgi:arylsulfatase
MMGHRSLYHEGWRAVCPVPGPSFKEAGMGFGELKLTEEKLRELDATGWELYHVAEDPSERVDLAAQHRDKLVELIALWYVEAGRYDVLPLDSRGVARFADERPQLARAREHYRYLPNTSGISENVAPRLLNRAHSITADVELTDGQEGVLLAQGGNTGGFTLFIKDDRVHYVHNYVGDEEFHVTSDTTLPKGRSEIRFEFEPTGPPDIAHGKGVPARAQLYVNRQLVGEAEVPVTMPLSMGLGEGLSCGRDTGSAVTGDYQSPFAFTGTLYRVDIDVTGELIEDKEATARAVMARQ